MSDVNQPVDKPGDAALVNPSAWPIRGVRVDGDCVIISVKGGNNAARWLCRELVALIPPNEVRREEKDCMQWWGRHGTQAPSEMKVEN